MWQQTEEDEMCLMDASIKSLRDVNLKPHHHNLNLHSNKITCIESLHPLTQLRHLDLSANQIGRIEGLETLASLKTLNLACNLLQTIEGLEGLRSLTKLNLSYNQIQDVTGLHSVSGHGYKISDIELQGNSISSLPQLTSNIRGLVHLRRLILSHMGASNPVCRMSGYRVEILAIAAQLDDLDGRDRDGQPCLDAANTTQDIPGLEKYLDYLMSNSSSEPDAVTLATPRINAALDAFKKRGVTSSELTSEGGASCCDNDTSDIAHRRKSAASENHENRLEKIEDQLAQLLFGTQQLETAERENKPNVVTRHSAKRDVDDTDESDEGQKPRSRSGSPSRSRKHARHSRIPSYQRSTSASRIKNEKRVTNASSTSQEEAPSYSKSPQTARRFATRVVSNSKGPTAIAQDECRRDDVQNTYVSLMKELENERERRWKAEQATRKLVDHIRDIQTKAKEEQGLNEVATEATSKLKLMLTAERESRLRCQAQVELIQEETEDLKVKLDKSENTTTNLQASLHTMETTANQQEHERLRRQAHESKKLAQATLKGAACQREAELLQVQVKELKGQVQQLQGLLADREQDHRKELTGRFSVGSPEFQDMLQKEVTKVEGVKSQEIKLQQTKIDDLSMKYKELEDEFRLALQIESNRFSELKIAFEKCSAENAENKQALLTAQRKDERSSEMLAELTCLVKEQKGRLTELSKNKAEQSAEYHDRLQTTETHLEEARRRMVQLELLKKERVKLESTVAGQESVIEGLKAERKLWGAELAQQGAALAQDRGRLDAKIDSMTSEVSTLKKQLEREADAVRIKTKLVEDQTETIRKLKAALVERDEDVRRAREEMLRVQRDLESQLAGEMAATQQAEDRVARLTDRKLELKQQVDELQDQLEQAKQDQRAASRQWKDKSAVIGQLEQQVANIKKTWESKEAKLVEGRDRAVNAASVAVDKLKSMDNAFRTQLDKKEAVHQAAMEALGREKQQEMDAASSRVVEVEAEMRELLREVDISKRATEEKVRRMTKALGELQQDLF